MKTWEYYGYESEEKIDNKKIKFNPLWKWLLEDQIIRAADVCQKSVIFEHHQKSLISEISCSDEGDCFGH